MNWFQKHKKGIITAGCIGLGIGFGLAGYAFFKKDGGLLLSNFTFSSKKTTVPCNTSPVVNEATKLATTKATEATTKIIDMDPFVRNLPPNCHPSINKVNTAVENGFPNLLENQTWVGPQQRTYKIKTA